MTQTIDKAQQTEVIREYWADLNGAWGYDVVCEALYADVADDFKIDRSVFDRFTEEIADGTRCLVCGQIALINRQCEGCLIAEEDNGRDGEDNYDDDQDA